MSANTQHLSSGNRIINAVDDVASFSVAAQLQSQVSSLKQISNNITQSNSLLQVASGGLQQVGTIIDTLKTLSIQASSSALTNTERSYIQQQFSSLVDQIDSLASTTSFNGIKLLDGSLAGGNQLLTQTSAATAATGTLTLTANPTAAQTVVVNGVSFVADGGVPATGFAIGVDASATATNLAVTLNASTDTRVSQATYLASGASIIVTAKAGGTVGNNFIINKASSTATLSVSGGSTVAANVYTLSGGLDNGLSSNTTHAVGTINETLLTAQNQTAANVTLSISGTVSDGETLLLGDGNGGNVTFTFRTAPVGATEIQIGATTEETLQNVVNSLSQYSTTSNYGIRQLDFTVNSGSVTLKNRTNGNLNDLTASPLTISETLANGTVSAASFNNGATAGVDVSGVTGSGFTGTVSGFTATYISANVIDVAVTVGANAYTARISDTQPVGNSTVRLSSAAGGFFDLQLAGGAGSAVSNQTTADSYATRLNTAFGSLSFYQDRQVTNYAPTGSLTGSSAKLQLNNGSTVRINSISIAAPGTPGADATIDFKLGDSTFRASAGLGGHIGAYESVKFTSISNSSQVLTFTNGATAQDFSTETAAATLETALSTAFHIGTPGTGTDFQVGLSATDTVNVSIDSVSSFSLFNGASPSVGTQLNAQAAQTSLTTARETVQTAISHVAGKQSSLNFAAANIQQSIIGISQAHSALADTDIVAESTDYALNTLKVNSAIAVIAQALSLPSSLLTVVRAAGKG